MVNQQHRENLFTIHQGEACPICFVFVDSDGDPIAPSNSNCQDLSISIGHCEKRYSRRVEGQNIEITYDSINKLWKYWLTQSDSYALPTGVVPVEVFIKIDSSNIPVVDVAPIMVLPASNKVIL